MKRLFRFALVAPILLLAVCVSGGGVAGEGEGDAPPPKEDAQAKPKARAELPWAPKEIADTIEDLSHPEWASRVEAIRKVVGAGRWIVPFLLVALKNPEPVNRMEAAYCLGRIGDPVASPSLIEVLEEDPTYDVIVYVADALGVLGDEDALPVLEPLTRYTLDREMYGRAEGPPGPIELKVIDSREATVRHAAAEAMARLGDNSALPVLIGGLTGNGWIRRDAAVRLRRITEAKVDFGFYLDMENEEMAQVQAQWMDWYGKNKETFRASTKPCFEALDVYMPRDDGDGGDEKKD